MKRLLIPALFAIAIVLLVTPIPEGMKPEAHRLIAVTFLMSGLWVTNVIPLAATSLMPLVLFPLLGIMKPDDVSKSYMSDTLFLYVGGMIIALGIERWQLHRRIALHLVNLVGISPKRLVLGFLLATGFLSMWISNTACTLLMLPIVLAMLRTMDEAASESGRTEATAVSLRAADAVQAPQNHEYKGISGRTDQLAVPLLLAIAYSSSLGGMTTLVGTPTNSSAAGIYRDQLPNAPEISMAAWLLVCGPIGAVYLAVTWFVLTRGLPGSTQADRLLQVDLREKLRSLGRPGVAEVRMFLVFAFTGLLWICRKPLIVGEWTLLPGWLDACTSLFRSLGPWFPEIPGVASKGELLSDATVSM
ncbi:MAG: SLC13 family permease, partial [Planctomyces sp.]